MLYKKLELPSNYDFFWIHFLVGY